MTTAIMDPAYRMNSSLSLSEAPGSSDRKGNNRHVCNSCQTGKAWSTVVDRRTVMLTRSAVGLPAQSSRGKMQAKLPQSSCSELELRGTWNEGAGDKASGYRERSETTDGRCDSGDGKSSGSHHEDSFQPCGHRDRDQKGAVLIGGPSPSGEVVAQMPQRQQKSGACFSSISTRTTFCTTLYQRNHWHGGGGA